MSALGSAKPIEPPAPGRVRRRRPGSHGALNMLTVTLGRVCGHGVGSFDRVRQDDVAARFEYVHGAVGECDIGHPGAAVERSAQVETMLAKLRPECVKGKDLLAVPVADMEPAVAIRDATMAPKTSRQVKVVARQSLASRRVGCHAVREVVANVDSAERELYPCRAAPAFDPQVLPEHARSCRVVRVNPARDRHRSESCRP